MKTTTTSTLAVPPPAPTLFTKSLNFKYGPNLGVSTKNLNIDLELNRLAKSKKNNTPLNLSHPSFRGTDTFENLISFDQNIILSTHKQTATKTSIVIPSNHQTKNFITISIPTNQSHAAHTITICAKKNSTANIIIDTTTQSQELPSLHSIAIQILAQQDATINLSTKHINAAKINFIHTNTKLEKGAQITLTDDLTTPSNSQQVNNSFTYLRVHQEITGEHATANIFTAIAQEQEQQLDLKTDISHLANNSNGKMLARSVLLDQSKLSFQGTIHIPKNIHNTNSHQNCTSLSLGENTRCDAVPVLDVHNDDVTVSHGVALGRVDEEQLFYLQSKGIPKEHAINMITKGFLAKALEHSPQSVQVNQSSNKSTISQVNE